MAIPTSTTVYGKIIPPRSKNDTTLKTKKIIGFKYPLELSPGKGYFSKSSGFMLVKSQLKSLIRTDRGERFMLPEFGCGLRRFLMEPIDEVLFNLIKNDIQVSIGKYLRKVRINKLQVLETRSNSINVKLFCSLKENAIVNFNVDIVV